ncbi:SDR family NAD(P)-dependent oxidoreductase, partial [Amylibacter sp.]|nr:SDR family NAD(P)-dependent oxidoreductase [Amylibacter sp.]
MILPSLPSFSLKGKRALVTGASSGIGQACAVAMAQSGAKVICVSRGIDLLNKTVSSINARGFDAEALA